MQHSGDDKDGRIDRRSFLQAAGAVAGTALATSALSYDRILGANDRIALGHIGIGNRGSGLHMMASRLKDKYNVETVAVCDLWKRNRDRSQNPLRVGSILFVDWKRSAEHPGFGCRIDVDVRIHDRSVPLADPVVVSPGEISVEERTIA